MTRNRKPYQMTNRCPENRQGTRTWFKFNMHMWGGNVPSPRKMARMKQRQWMKAHKLWQSGKLPREVQGRLVRAALEYVYESEGQYADSLYYGHP